MNKIFVEDRFLSDKECDYLIHLHQQMKEHDQFRDTKIINLNGFYTESNYVRYLLTKLSFFAQTCYNDINIYLNYAEVVEWHGVGMQPRRDFAYHPMTSIVYLNDDYEGGETLIGDVAITPKKGKIVCFNGDESVHGVNDFTNKRYTIASWFSNGKYIIT